jgi:acyl-CoA synthetase (AMP-forming)/AMP-acid ligase II
VTMTDSLRDLDAALRIYETAGIWQEETLPARVLQHARSNPDASAVIDAGGVTSTWADLWNDAQRVAGFLRDDLGLQPGAVISVQLPNYYVTTVIQLAALTGGYVLNILLPNYGPRDVYSALSRSRARAFFTLDRFRSKANAETLRLIAAQLPEVAVEVISDVTIRSPSDALAFAPSHSDSDIRTWSTSRPVTEPSALIFTSGTEAKPKGILHSEATANAGVRIAHDHLGMSADEVVWMPSPIGHSTGFNFGVRMAFYYGYPLVLQDRWNADEAVDLVVHTGATYTLAATTFLADLVAACEVRPVGLPTLRYFGCGGAPIPPALVARAFDSQIGVLRLYGSTEALVPAWNTPRAPVGPRLRTDGSVIEGVELEIRDEVGQPVAAGTVGDIYVRGPQVCVGFLEDSERLAQAFSTDGWLQSGDLGHLDDAGYLTVDGRRKEIIIRGGLNISPREIEELILQIANVRDCVLVGLPDDRLGEISCACVVIGDDSVTLTLAEVCDHLTQAGLATYKLPERLLITHALPRTPSGKVRRNVVIEAWASGEKLTDPRARSIDHWTDAE